MKKTTPDVANSDIMRGQKLYLQRARNAFPILVRQAKVNQPIYYSDLAEELAIPNPRNLNFVLGAIGNAILELADQYEIEIPPLTCLVLNKRTGLPSEGITYFISHAQFNKMSKSQKLEIVRENLRDIFYYQDWEWVLNEFGLKPALNNGSEIIKKAKIFRGNGGESPDHQKLKAYISKNPEIIGVEGKLKNTVVEYQLPSSDKVDVLFDQFERKIAVEVKSIISDETDILRGLFQCVKYKSLLEAEQRVKNEKPNCRSVLVLQGSLPPSLLAIKNSLGIEVIEKVSCH